MIYIKLSQAPKTLAIALTLAGAYCNIPLANADSLAQAQSSIADVSTSTPTHQNSAQLKGLSAQEESTQIKNSADRSTENQRFGTALTPNGEYLTDALGVQVAQSENGPTDRGAPDDTLGAGTHAFTAPPNRGAPAPGQRKGAGSRGSCPEVAKPLTALVPIIQETANGGNSPTPEITTSDSVLGLTVAEHPTFWFYVPYSLNSPPSVLSVEFVLQDENSKEVYKTVLTTAENSPGVFSFELPSTAPALEVGRRYYWNLTISCDNPLSQENSWDYGKKPYVDGWVERVELNPSLKTQLEQATPLQRVALYAKAGIWHEAVTSLGKLRRENPKNAALMDDWNELLKSVDLDAIAQDPIQSMFTAQE
jgi:hypothetical protein